MCDYPVTIAVLLSLWFTFGFISAGYFWAYTNRYWNIAVSSDDYVLCFMIMMGGFISAIACGITFIGDKLSGRYHGWVVPFSKVVD